MTEDDDLALDRPVDRVTPTHFREILSAYADDERIEGGVCRFELDDGTERRLVIAEDIPSLDDDAYAKLEIGELIGLFEDTEDLLDRPIELSIPVADTERVVTQAEEEGEVTVWFEPEGIKTLLEQLLVGLEAEGGELDEEADPDADEE